MKNSIFLLTCLFLLAIGCTLTKNTSTSEKIYSAQQYIDLGKQYMREKKFSAAKVSFIKASKLDSESIEAYGLAGIAAKYNRDYDEAIGYFNKVLELDPNEIKAYGSIGQISIRLKNYGESIKAFTKVVEINPNDFGALDGLIESYFRTSNFRYCQLYLNKFDEAVLKTDGNLLSEKTKQNIEKAKRRHSSYRKTMSE